jgi:type I restriction enzyme S subunit
MKETKNVPQLRFSGFDDEWEEKKLGDTICEVNERTSDFNKNPLFSLTIENGITEKTERYERSQLVTKDDDLFKIMHPQNFATNPMNLRFGAVGYSKEKQDISVSGYYDVFSIDNNECSDFWYSYFKTDKILKKFDDAATGSLIEKRRVHFSVLKQLVFLQPNYKEKQKIGAFLSHVDSLIQAKTKLSPLSRQFV